MNLRGARGTSGDVILRATRGEGGQEVGKRSEGDTDRAQETENSARECYRLEEGVHVDVLILVLTSDETLESRRRLMS